MSSLGLPNDGPADALWLLGVTFFLIIVLAGTLVPLYAAIFVRLDERSARIERVLVRFGVGLLYFALFVVGGLAVGLGLAVMARVWRLT